MKPRAFLLGILLWCDLSYAQAAPVWSSEVPISPAVPGPAVVPHGGASAAWDGENFLVAWTRFGQVVAARVDGDGDLVDRVPIRLDTEQPYPSDTAVASNGETYLVVWRSYFSSVIGRILDREGRPLGPVQYFGANSVSGRPIVVSNGDNYLILAGNAARATLVGRDGKVSSVVLPDAARFGPRAAASDGRDYMIVLSEIFPFQQNQLFRVTAEGEFRGPTTMPWDSSPRLAWDGTQYLLATQGSLITLDRDGRENRPRQPLPIPSRSSVTLQAANAGEAILLVEEGTDDPERAPTSITPIVSGTPGEKQVLPIDAKRALLVPGSGRYLLVWAKSYNLYHTILDSQFGPGSVEGTPTAISAIEQKAPAAAAVEGGWFVAWRERDHENRVQIRGSVVSPHLGTRSMFPVAPGGLMFLSPDAPTGSPAIANSGNVVLVVWYVRGGAQLVGRRFTTEGHSIDDEPFVVATNTNTWNEREDFRRAAIVWNGRYFLVATGGVAIRVTRVTETGSVLDPEGISIPESGRGSRIQVYPSLAAVGETSILVFQDGDLPVPCQITCPGPPPLARIESLRLDIEGRPMDAKPTVLSSPGTLPRVAWNGKVALAVWQLSYDVQAMRLGADGLPLDGGQPLQLSTLEVGGTQPYVDAVADGFFVAWVGAGVTARFVASSGSLQPILKLTSEPASETPVVSSRMDGKVLALYSRWSHIDGGVFRTYYRGFGPAPPRPRGVRRGSS